jgi:hypothetical protein
MPNADSAGLSNQPGSESPRDKSRKWRLRPRLLLVIAIPTAAALALGGVSIAGSWQSAAADQRSGTLASLSTKVTQLAFQIEAERDAIVWYIAAGKDGRAGQLSRHADAASGDQLQIVDQQFAFTAPWLKTVTTGVAGVGSGFPRAAQVAAGAAAASLRTLPNLRRLALHTQVSAGEVLADYGSLLDRLLNLDDQIPLNSDDPQIISTSRAMAAVSRYENEAGVQRAIVMSVLTSGTMTPEMLTQLTTSMANQKADAADFQNFATASQTEMFNGALDASLDDRVITDEQAVIQDAKREVAVAVTPADWYGAASSVVGAAHKYEETLATSATDRARALHNRAVTSTLVVGGILVLVLIFSLLLVMYVGRFMTERQRPVTALGLSASG